MALGLFPPVWEQMCQNVQDFSIGNVKGDTSM